jgi:hypothetical protein
LRHCIFVSHPDRPIYCNVVQRAHCEASHIFFGGGKALS